MPQPKTMRALLILALALVACQALAGLQATSVLLPTSDVSEPPAGDGRLQIAADGSSPIQATKIVHLEFDLNNLPADARIDRVTLRLEGRANNANPQLVRVFTNREGQDDSVGTWTATGERGVFDLRSDALLGLVVEAHRNRGPLDLWLRSLSRYSDWSYASTRAFDDQPGAKPRLIVSYSRDLPPPQATDRTEWRLFGEKNSFRATPLRPKETLLTQPVFYGNDLYLFAKPDESTTNLLALTTNGREDWHSAIQQAPGSHTAVDADGLLYAIGQERVTRFDLDQRGQIVADTSIKDLRPSVTPTLGLDGSLYVSVYGYLYGLNPALQEVWRYPQAKTEAAFSPVALSSSGQAQAFVLARLRNNNALTTIDTGSGESNEQPLDLKYTQFHPPVVIPDPQGDYVCLAVNSQQDGLLACHAGGEQIWSRTGPVSQPLASADGSRLFVVQSGCLRALDRLNGKDLASACPEGLQATSNLVSDGDGKVYLWNNGKLLSFDRDCIRLGEQPLHDLPEALRLLFAPDGTLFAVNPKSRQLYSLVPERESLTLDQANLRGDTIYFADALRIAPSTRLEAKTRVALRARNGIAVGRGLSVAKGARLSLATGY